MAFAPYTFANPAIAAQQAADPRLAYAQGLAQTGASTAPVQSWGEGLARALQAGVGGALSSRVNQGYQDQDTSYRAALANALKSDDPLAALGASQDPTLQNQGLQMRLALVKSNAEAKAALVNDLAKQGKRVNAQGVIEPIPGFGQAAGQISADTISAETPAKVAQGEAMIGVDVQKAKQVALATLPIEMQKAIGIAQAQSDIDIQKALKMLPINVQQQLAVAAGSANITANSPQQILANTEKLSDDFRSEKTVQGWQTVAPIVASMKDAVTRKTRSADLNLVYGMAKLMDPGSVVREGEQVLVQNTQALPDWLVGQINRLNGGQGLSDDARKGLMAEVDSRTAGIKDAYDQTVKFYQDKAGRLKIDPKNVILDIQQPQVSVASPIGTPLPTTPTPQVPTSQGTIQPRGTITQKYNLTPPSAP